VGIGTTLPSNGRLVVRGTVGAVSALFGDNTTGVAIENSFPGIGLNTYFNGTRKYIAPGFGGLIGLDPNNGNMYLMNTAVSGAADGAAALNTRLFVEGSTGFVGIGTTTMFGKLTVDGANVNTGIFGSGSGTTVSAIRAENFATSGPGYGLLAYSQNGTAVSASSPAATGYALRTSGRTELGGQMGINTTVTAGNLISIDASGFSDGISIYSNSGNTAAIRAENFSSGTSTFALVAYGQNGSAINASTAGTSGTALSASATGTSAWAIRATGRSEFGGNVSIIGNLSKSSGTFKIDHPQDPANKFLIHSFVESPDMMNVYNGNAETDANGLATVLLPGYFEAENIDFKYQLTVMGKQFAQAIVFEEISHNRFVVKTDKPHIKVSWQVTGVRNDPYAQKNRIVAEVEKTGEERGKYLMPGLYGQPAEKAINYQKRERTKE
jgi:hypothetical protein